jgi:hypothetical protein
MKNLHGVRLVELLRSKNRTLHWEAGGVELCPGVFWAKMLDIRIGGAKQALGVDWAWTIYETQTAEAWGVWERGGGFDSNMLLEATLSVWGVYSSKGGRFLHKPLVLERALTAEEWLGLAVQLEELEADGWQDLVIQQEKAWTLEAIEECVKSWCEKYNVEVRFSYQGIACALSEELAHYIESRKQSEDGAREA